MPTESLSTADYAAVINDLRAKCAEIQRTIAFLEALSGVRAAPAPSVPQEQQRPSVTVAASPGLAGLGQADACVWLLRKTGKPMTTREIADGLAAAGFKTLSTEPVNNVSAAMHHRSKRKGDVARDGKHWRLVTGKPANGEAMATLNGAESIN